ncbi:MAG: type III-B CRISPR module RAMP protein Cmr6 [Leptospiraceae bacterium]|nr:type III-B CRISPR module RAMP protein Cmr6 [Leptospiraceae bacterium]MCP5503236.1 type III-B CRISPR module RAMP protein Cmr6 [Leptospiraceae bacterium]
MPKDRQPKQTQGLESIGEHFGKTPEYTKPVDKDNSSPYLLPRDTVRVLKESNYSIENTYLWFHRLRDFNFNRNEFFKLKGTDKFPYLRGKKDSFDFTKFNKRQYENAETIFQKENIFRILLTTSWKLAIGLGDHSVLETSVTLHPVYGFPYIPGSAIKGTLRSYIIEEFFNCDEKKAFKDKGFCLLFGSPKESQLKEHKGILTFFDAYPTHTPNLSLDIMNPHFGDYYQDTTNKKPPADYYNPVPVTFPVVENTTFQFLVGVDRKYNGVLEEGSFFGRLPKILIEQLLIECLQNKGIGAKTSAGYGRMRELNVSYYLNCEKTKEYYESLIEKKLQENNIPNYIKNNPITHGIIIHTVDEAQDKNLIFKSIESYIKNNIPFKIFVFADDPEIKEIDLKKYESSKKVKEKLLKEYKNNTIEFKKEEELKNSISIFLRNITKRDVQDAKIINLKLKNIGLFDELELGFEENFNVYIGNNGSGKSTILRAIALGLVGHNYNGIDKEKLIYSLPKRKGRNGKYVIVDEALIELQIKIGEETFTNIINFVKDGEEKSGFRIESKLGFAGGKDSSFILNYLAIGFDQTRTKASILEPAELNGFIEPNASDLFSVINDTQDKKMLSVIAWLANLDNDERNNHQTSKESAELKALVFDTISKILGEADSIKFKKLVNVEPIEIDITTPIAPQGVDIRLASDGEQSTMGMIGYIIERMRECFSGEKDFLKRSGIVIIDEIDSYLHPSAQRNIIPLLSEIFPNVQFIVSTHSPFVLNQLTPDSVKIVKDRIIKSIKDLLSNYNTYGADIKEIIEEVVFPNEKYPYYPPKVKEGFIEYFMSIDDNNFEKAEKIKKTLINETGVDSDHPEFLKGESQIKLKRLFKR